MSPVHWRLHRSAGRAKASHVPQPNSVPKFSDSARVTHRIRHRNARERKNVRSLAPLAPSVAPRCHAVTHEYARVPLSPRRARGHRAVSRPNTHRPFFLPRPRGLCGPSGLLLDDACRERGRRRRAVWLRGWGRRRRRPGGIGAAFRFRCRRAGHVALRRSRAPTAARRGQQ